MAEEVFIVIMKLKSERYIRPINNDLEWGNLVKVRF